MVEYKVIKHDDINPIICVDWKYFDQIEKLWLSGEPEFSYNCYKYSVFTMGSNISDNYITLRLFKND